MLGERSGGEKGGERGRVQFLRDSPRLGRSPAPTLSSFPRVRSRRQPREAYSRWRPFRLLPSPSTARATSSVASPRSSPSRSSTARRSSSSAASSSTLPAPSSATRLAATLFGSTQPLLPPPSASRHGVSEGRGSRLGEAAGGRARRESTSPPSPNRYSRLSALARGHIHGLMGGNRTIWGSRAGLGSRVGTSRAVSGHLTSGPQ